MIVILIFYDLPLQCFVRVLGGRRTKGNCFSGGLRWNSREVWISRNRWSRAHVARIGSFGTIHGNKTWTGVETNLNIKRDACKISRAPPIATVCACLQIQIYSILNEKLKLVTSIKLFTTDFKWSFSIWCVYVINIRIVWYCEYL